MRRKRKICSKRSLYTLAKGAKRVELRGQHRLAAKGAWEGRLLLYRDNEGFTSPSAPPVACPAARSSHLHHGWLPVGR